jgi:hypothetical protein
MDIDINEDDSLSTTLGTESLAAKVAHHLASHTTWRATKAHASHSDPWVIYHCNDHEMASITLYSEQLIEETLHLANGGVYDSIRQASLATGAPRSTVGHRRAGRPPRSQIIVRNARLTSKQETTLMR